MSFFLLKGLHIACAFISYTLFFLRGFWSFKGAPIMKQGWIKTVPHIVDTLLLISAIALAFIIHQYPFVDIWLTAKVLGVFLYIGLGFIALKYGKSKSVRILSWLAAQVVFIFIVLVAIFHNAVSFS